MATEWFYSQNGQRFGPVGSAELKRLADAGRLRPADMVWKQGLAQWVAAASIQGLFPPAVTAQPVQAPPAPPSPPNPPAGGQLLNSVGQWFGVQQPPGPEFVFATSPAGQLVPINDQIPPEHRHQLMAGEKVFHFAFIDFSSGGCAGSGGASKQWVLVSNLRILYQASVKQQEGMQSDYQQTSGSIPISKVSFVGTVVNEKSDGCNSRKIYLLRINSGGGQIELAIPSEAEARRLQAMIDRLITTQ